MTMMDKLRRMPLKWKVNSKSSISFSKASPNCTPLYLQLLYGGQSVIMVGIVINRYNLIVEAQKNPAPKEIAMIQVTRDKLNADMDRNR
jgi:hypothetical protein